MLFREDMLATIIEELKKEGIIKDIPSKTSNEATSSIKVGDPAKFPEGMGNAAIDFGASQEKVFRIFIQLMQREGKDKPEWLFIVDHAGRNDEILKELGNAMGPYLDGLDIVMIDMGDPLSEKVIQGKIPVYAR